jgi:hypothetical protein
MATEAGRNPLITMDVFIGRRYSKRWGRRERTGRYQKEITGSMIPSRVVFSGRVKHEDQGILF